MVYTNCDAIIYTADEMDQGEINLAKMMCLSVTISHIKHDLHTAHLICIYVADFCISQCFGS